MIARIVLFFFCTDRRSRKTEAFYFFEHCLAAITRSECISCKYLESNDNGAIQ